MDADYREWKRLAAQKAQGWLPMAEPADGHAPGWLLRLGQSPLDRWLRWMCGELLPAVEFGGRLEFGSLLPARHPFRAACEGLGAWSRGAAAVVPVALGHGFGAQGNLAELIRLCSAFSRIGVQIGRISELAAEQAWSEPLHREMLSAILGRETTELADRLAALFYRLTDIEDRQAWIASTARAFLDGASLPSGMDILALPPAPELPVAYPDPADWLEHLRQAISGLTGPQRASRATWLEDVISKNIRAARIFTGLAGSSHPGTVSPSTSGRRWPTDTVPSADWAGAAIARVELAAASAVAADSDSTAGLLRTLALIGEAVWATELAGHLAFASGTDAQAIAMAQKGLSRFRLASLASLGFPERRQSTIYHLSTPKPLSAAPSDDLHGLLYAATPDEVTAYFTTVIKELADLIDPQEWYVTKQALKAVSSFGQPPDPELLQTLGRVRISEPQKTLLGYAAGLAWRSIARSREVLPRRPIPVPGERPADWERSYAGEADRAAALHALAAVAQEAGLPGDWLVQRFPRPLCTDEWVYGPAGARDVEAIRVMPKARWVTELPPAGPQPSRMVVSDRGLIVTSDAPGFALLDPATGVLRRRSAQVFGGLAGRVVVSGADTAHDAITGAEVPVPPVIPAFPDPGYRTHDGLIVQESALAGDLSYDAVGTVIRARESDGATLWEASVGELISHLRPQADTYPVDPGDHGYGVVAMTPAAGCLYVLTTGSLLLRLEADPASALYAPLEVRRPASDRLPSDVEEVTGWRWATRVSAGQENVLLCGPEPYTAERVYHELIERGYQVSRVSGGVGWTATMAGPVPERYRVHVLKGSSAKWYSLVGPRWVTLDRWHRRWFRWYKQEDMFHDDDRFIYVSDEMARRITLAQGAELLDDAARALVHQYAWARMTRAQHRAEGFTESRRRKFTPYLPALEAQAAALAEQEPVRDEVRRGYAPDRQTVALTPAVTARLDDSFPLVRLNYGSFGSPLLLVNRLHIEGVTYSLYAHLWFSPLEYLAVTPFCPEEGYQLDAEDLDPARRAAKVDRCHWGPSPGGEDVFPVSPWRLWTYVDHDADPGSAAAVLAESLWLELTFPGGQVFRSASYRRGDWGMVYDEWIPESFGLLPVVHGLAPEWVSIQLPKLPELLKTVTARLRYLPDEPRPAATGYFEVQYP